MRNTFLAALLPLCLALVAGCSSAAGSEAVATSSSAPKTLSPDDPQALSLLPVEELKEELDNALENISASNQAAYIATDAQALTWLTNQVKAAGIADPTTATYVIQVKKFALGDDIPFDHTETDIMEASGGGKTVKLSQGRILGDIWGAGLYADTTLVGNDLGPALCVTWKQLVQAIAVSYVPGDYLIDFVCHNITFRLLDTLGVSVTDYSSQVRAWTLASFAFGPIFAKTPSADATSSTPALTCKEDKLASPN